MSNNKLSVDDATLSLAAYVTERASELIADGWVRGKMVDGNGGLPTAFCIHGAINLALEEIFGNRTNTEIEALSTAFILDEAAAQYGHTGTSNGRIPAASFNDAAERQHDEVLSVLNSAADRLWDLSLERTSQDVDSEWIPSKWADVDVDSEDAKQFMHSTLN